VTEGIVSGLGRTLGGGAGRPLRQLIQSDAAINPGNSGGALFNARGEVIGITSAIENPNGERVFVGIGYAVPINTAQRFLPDMIQGRRIEHPRLGIGLQNLTPAVAETLGISVDQGVLITQVEPSSASSRAGLRGGSTAGAVGDVIVQIDDKQIRTFDDLANYLDSKKVGDTVKVKIVRDGKEATVDVTLEAWQQNSA
jgi:S1-C subfamily serine protease